MEKYIRDENSHAILSTNLAEKTRLAENREKARKAADLEKRVTELEKKVESLLEKFISNVSS